METAEGKMRLRSKLHPGDLGAIIALHGTTYSREQKYDLSFEAYVAGPLAEFTLRASPREKLWLAERAGKLAGCVAVVEAPDETGQIRWFLVEANSRGLGIGRKLLTEAVRFCKSAKYESVTLWTVGALFAASRLYQSFGFQKVEEKPGSKWGVQVVEEKYELKL
ncbi:MAG: N-acetyltransferase [Gemmataceae bacterium]|nr:N-acetyltransferase [Gemmataceae bacterium]